MPGFLVLAILIIAAYAYYRSKRAKPGQSAQPLGRKRKSVCKWQGTGQTKGALKEFRCTTCSAVAYSVLSSGPIDCKKQFGRGEL